MKNHVCRSATWRVLASLVLGLAVAACDNGPDKVDPNPLDALLSDAFSDAASGGVVLIAKDGEPVLRRAYGMADVELGVAMQPEHVLGVGSVTKQMTAVAILQLVSKGLISLDADIHAYVPEFETHGRLITVDQLLSHTSGLPNFVDRDDFDLIARQSHSVDELIAMTRDMPLHFEPGHGFYYSDTGYILLGAIIERVAGISYGNYIEQNLFRPLGMHDSWYGDDTRIIPGRARGYTMRDGQLANADFIDMTVPHAAGAVFSTVDDLLRWNNALLDGEVLPGELLQRAWTPRTLPDGTRSGYGYGWKLCSIAGHPTIEHGGYINGYLANLLQMPEAGLTIIVLVNNDGDVPDPGRLARQLARQVLTGSPALHEVTLTHAQRDALAGRYVTAAGSAIEISDHAGILYAQYGGQDPQPLTAMSDAVFTTANGDDDIVLTFETGDDGRATSFSSALRCEPRYLAIRQAAAR